MYFTLGIITGVIILFILKSKDSKKVTPVTMESNNLDCIIIMDDILSQLKIKMNMGLTGHHFMIDKSRWSTELESNIKSLLNYYPSMRCTVLKDRNQYRVKLDWRYPLFDIKEYGIRR